MLLKKVIQKTITLIIVIIKIIIAIITTTTTFMMIITIVAITTIITMTMTNIIINLGVHSYIDHIDGHPRLAAPHGRHAGRYLRENCQGERKDLWWKNHGHDHFLIFRFVKNVLQ